MRHINVALTPDGRCPLCRARYATFRAGVSAKKAQLANLTSEAGADWDGMTDEEDRKRLLSAGCGMKLAGQIKRAAWDEYHGPGRCFPDVWTPIIERRRTEGLTSEADRAWNLAELVADLILGDEERVAEDGSVEADVTFDIEMLSVPEYIDDGQATTCIAA